jgi:hypothetical protein
LSLLKEGDGMTETVFRIQPGELGWWDGEDNTDEQIELLST